ncbi:MAG: TolC family protein [Phycisphaeraceae bacterium]|nr:TolC family protein [Phycisphaeraceae bacterium]
MAALGKDTISPRITSPNSLPGENNPANVAKSLPTTNPDAADLPFQAQQPNFEADAVDRRLTTMQEAVSQGARELSLEGALQQAQLTAREFITAEEDYILSAIRLLSERHLWDPILTNETTASVSGSWEQGQPASAFNVLNELRLAQRLPFGGQVAARWLWNATENLRETATGSYTQASSIVVDANVPLMRGAGMIAQEGLIQSERNLIYAARDFETFRRRFLVDICRDFFGLAQLKQSIGNTEKRYLSLQREQRRKEALYEAGRVAQTEVAIAKSDVLQAASSVAAQRESYILALDRFKIRLGLGVNERIAVSDSALAALDLPLPETTMVQAVERALTYRLDLQNRRDQIDDSQRQVANARNLILPELNAVASVTIPTDPGDDVGGIYFSPENSAYFAGLTFSMPLDRERERLALRQSIISFEQAKREFERFRDDLIVGVRSDVREIERAKYALLLAEDSVKTNERRKQEQDLKPIETTSQQIVDTENSLQSARDARDQAATDLRLAVLNYLLDTGQLRVARDGTFKPLAGMVLPTGPDQPADPPGTAPAGAP